MPAHRTVVSGLAVLCCSVSAHAAPVCAVGRAVDACNTPTRPERIEAVGATSMLDTLGRGTWVIDEENDEVALVTPFGSSRRFHVGRWPQALVVESTGRVFVSCRQEGTVDVIDAAFGQARLEAGEEPRALALDETGQRLYVGLVTAKAVLALDTRLLQPAARVDLPDPPRALALTAGGLAVASARCTSVRVFDRSLQGEPTVVNLPLTRAAVLSPQLLVPIGDGVLIIAERARTGLNQPVSSGGYGGQQASLVDTLVFSVRGLDRGYAPAVLLASLTAPEPVSASLRRGVLWVASRGLGRVLAVGVDPETMLAGGVVELIPGPHRGVPAPARFSSFDGASIFNEVDLTGLALGERGELVLTDALGRQLLQGEPDRATQRTLGMPSGLFGGLGLTGMGGLGNVGLGLGSRGGFFEDGENFAFGRALPVRTTPLAEGADVELRVGAHLFHNTAEPRISNHGVACASCHPDGRDDGRVWQLKGTRRQTPMLTGRLHDTAPFNWLGSAKTLKANLVNTIVDRLEGEGLPPRELRALTRFISDGLRPVTLPAPKEPELVALGETVFNDAIVGCGTCHPADLALTDGERHDVGSLSDREKREFALAHPLLSGGVPSRLLRPMLRAEGIRNNRLNVTASMFVGTVQSLPVAIVTRPVVPRKFDTPSLKYVALSAPYFHDGASATLEELIANNHDRMGTTSQLSDLERRALVAYLQTL